MRVALSASYYNVKAVADVLRTCDEIWTTNVTARRQLNMIFPGKIVVYRGSAPDEDTFPEDTEIITFRDLRKIVKEALLAGDQQAAESLLEYCGWDYQAVTLYDEEGVPGWEFTRNHTTLASVTSLGDKFEVPVDVMNEMAAGF